MKSYSTIIRDIKPLCDDVKSFTIEYPISLPSYDPGSHIDVKVLVSDRLETRSYSVVEKKDDNHLMIAVRSLPNGKGGSIYMHNLQVDQRLEATLPSNNFTLGLNAEKYLFLAGGIGITPLIGMARVLVQKRKPFQFVYLGRTRTAMPFLDELRHELGDAFQHFSDDEDGQFDFGRLISGLEQDTEVYMCGPVPMMEAVRHLWADLGRPLDRLRLETFGGASGNPNQPFQVSIPSKGLEFTVPANRSLLDVLDEVGAEPLYSCRRGECGLCAVDVVSLEGEIEHRDVFFSERQKQEAKHLCSCVSRVAGKVILELP